MNRKKIAFFFFYIFCSWVGQGQDFLNKDLDGDASILSNLPTYWQNVLDTDPNCQASWPGGATPDETDINGPTPSGGIMGNPYSGPTFLSGLFAKTEDGYTYQEGIMQTVSGFNVGCKYNVYFFQAVVKQNNCLDPSGNWSVYVDDILAGTTVSTVNLEPANSISLKWELRHVSFIATEAMHTIKFLPTDDDTDQINDASHLQGGLRMGIDSIFIKQVFSSTNNITLCKGDSVFLNLYYKVLATNGTLALLATPCSFCLREITGSKLILIVAYR